MNTFKKIDFTLIICYLLLVGSGWTNIYSVTSGPDDSVFLWGLNTFAFKQLLWIVISIGVGIIILITRFQFLTYWGMLFMLLVLYCS